ncbi:Secretory immunoglobulin A-binding protein EsiB [Bradyrhizobium ivorense]|uniref:Secretory immunoglobulin A-binding protein EsiB n=1 Tax=Bradyrhizobium ivorense TaxID=2511166 RepID=A0A508TS09_9BRAD|nr:tetratricopeptide repeat protein [Bradyrhizobium ivorense]VIO77073.1 Secretory immunoglobulin A-binding protein EsiB [Bradyrhizobium ivorense]
MPQSIFPAVKKSAWQRLLQLWHGNGSFRGFLEFAAIGAVVVAFLHGSNFGVLKWVGSAVGSKIASAVTSKGWTARPPMLSDVMFDGSYFAARPEPLHSKLTFATIAIQARQSGEVERLLAGTDANDPSVQLVKGTAALMSPDPRSYSAGLELLRQAARQGEAKAMAILGLAMILGHGGQDQNAELGRQYLQQAIDAGDARAAHVLAAGYFTGWAGRVDPVAGAGLMRRAAERGDTDSMFQYAIMLVRGLGVTKSAVEGEAWLLRAAERGHAGAQSEFGLARLIDFNRQLTTDAGPAITWLSRAAEQNEPDAMFALGMFYTSIKPSTSYSNPVRGTGLLETCSRQTLDSRCTFAYATMLENGHGTAIDLVRAHAFYRLSNDVKDTSEGRKRLADLEKQLSGGDLAKARHLAQEVRERYMAGTRRPVLGNYAPVPTPLDGH